MENRIDMKHVLLVTCTFLSIISYAQSNISVEVSADTIEVGKTVEIKYTIQNGDGKFILPALDSLPVISGPNSSSSFMYQNGEQSYRQSYSFLLLAMEEGTLKVPEAYYIKGDEKTTIQPVVVVVGNKTGSSITIAQPPAAESSKSKREKRVF